MDMSRCFQIDAVMYLEYWYITEIPFFFHLLSMYAVIYLCGLLSCSISCGNSVIYLGSHNINWNFIG